MPRTHVLAVKTTQGPVVRSWQRWLLQLLLQRRALGTTYSRRDLTKSSSCHYRSCVPSTHALNVMYHVTTNPETRSSSSESQGGKRRATGEDHSWCVEDQGECLPLPRDAYLSKSRFWLAETALPLPFMPNFCRYCYLKGRNPIYPSINSLYHLPQHRLYHSQMSIRQQFQILI